MKPEDLNDEQLNLFLDNQKRMDKFVEDITKKIKIPRSLKARIGCTGSVSEDNIVNLVPSIMIFHSFEETRKKREPLYKVFRQFEAMGYFWWGVIWAPTGNPEDPQTKKGIFELLETGLICRMEK